MVYKKKSLEQKMVLKRAVERYEIKPFLRFELLNPSLGYTVPVVKRKILKITLKSLI